MSRFILLSVAVLAVAAGPATTPADSEDKPYASAAEILAKLPRECRPGRGGHWDEFNTPKANDWLKHNVPLSAEFIGDLPLAEASIDPVTDPLGGDKVDQWSISLSVEPSPLRFDGIEGNAIIGPSEFRAERWKFQGDEKLARAARGWKRGERVAVKANIWSVRVEYGESGTRVDPPGTPRHQVATYTVILDKIQVVRVGTTKIPEPEKHE